MDEDTLRALNYANELLHQQEQELLRADPAWLRWLEQLEQEHTHDERE